VGYKRERRARVDDTRAIQNRSRTWKILGRGWMVEGRKGTSGKKQIRKTPRTVAALTLRCHQWQRRETAIGRPQSWRVVRSGCMPCGAASSDTLTMERLCSEGNTSAADSPVSLCNAAAMDSSR
jgi:hypothetical protein